MEFLALTAGAVTVKKFIQRIAEFDSRTFIGKGKLDEIAKFINEKDITLTIFDDELSGSQLRNIEKVLNSIFLKAKIYSKPTVATVTNKGIRLNNLLPR